MTESGGGGRLKQVLGPLTDRYHRYYERLTTRDQRLLQTFFSLLVLVATWSAVSGMFWDPYLQKKDELAALKSDMLEVQTLSDEIRKTRSLISAQSLRLGREERGFSLISYLEEEADHARIKSLITQMTPRTLTPEGPYQIRMVSMRIESVDLPHTLFFLARLERSPHFIRITRLSVKRRFNNHAKLDVQINVEAVQSS